MIRNFPIGAAGVPGAAILKGLVGAGRKPFGLARADPAAAKPLSMWLLHQIIPRSAGRHRIIKAQLSRVGIVEILDALHGQVFPERSPS